MADPAPGAATSGAGSAGDSTGEAIPASGEAIPSRGEAATATRGAVEVEVIGGDPALLRPPAEAALAAAGVGEGHAAIALVDEAEIRRLNREHRGIDRPTDVLSFPVDAVGPAHGPRELGDVVICPGHTEDFAEAVVHGVLHLCGYDHERDGGEMLALQHRVMADLR